MDQPSTPNDNPSSDNPTEPTTPQTNNPQSVSPTAYNKPLPKRLASLPGAAEHFAINGEKMMLGYKRTRAPNKKKTNNPAESAQKSSQHAAASDAHMSVQQHGIGGAGGYDPYGTISLTPAPSGAQQHPNYYGESYPSMPDPTYSQSSFPTFTNSGFYGTTTNPLEGAYPMDVNTVASMSQNYIQHQAPEIMQRAGSQYPFGITLGADTAGLPMPTDLFLAQGSLADFEQYHVSSFQGASDVEVLGLGWV